MKLLSREEVGKIDQKAVKSGQPQTALIEMVGARLSQWLHPKIARDHKVLVLMGPGNNGDDAAVVHRRLRHHVEHLVGLRIGKQNSIFLHSEETLYTLENYNKLNLKQFDWVIDGMFGTGLNRPLSEPVNNLIKKINQTLAKKVAIDIPTGVDANTGEIHGEAFQADHTLTIAAPKRGLFLLPGRDFCGDVQVIEVEILNQMLNNVEVKTTALPHYNFLGLRPTRSQNKYSRGHVAVAMSNDFPGAALMVAFAAQKSGAGYVEVFCPEEKLSFLQIQHPFLVFTGYKDSEDLSKKMEGDCLVIGAGWKEFPENFSFPDNGKRTFVLDGGFLTPSIFKKTKGFASRCVLTPHGGELHRLQGDFKGGKWERVDHLLSKWDGTIIAKGYDTIVGQGKNQRWLTTWNSRTLATAGTGDILAGLTAAFLAQGFPPPQASCLAVDAHRRLAARNKVSVSPQTLLNRIELVLNSKQ